MKRKRELAEIITDIKNEIPGFNKDELLKYTEWAIPKLYNSIKNDEQIEIKCKPELIKKLQTEREEYRISKKIDSIGIHYTELYENIKKENEMYIEVYISLSFYDNVENNIGDSSINDKYWNDIWIVTYKESGKSEKKNSNCVNCGAIMEYDHARNIFECKYCGNKIDNNTDSIWEIVDITIKK